MLKMKTIAIAFFALLGLIQYPLWFSKEGSVLSAWRLQQEVETRQQQQQARVQRNQLLIAQIDGLKNGEEMVESHARYDLGMVKKGEVFYQITDSV